MARRNRSAIRSSDLAIQKKLLRYGQVDSSMSTGGITERVIPTDICRILLHLIHHIQDQRKERHTHQHAVISLSENRKIGIAIKIVVQLIGISAGITRQGMHNDSVRFAILSINRLVKAESPPV